MSDLAYRDELWDVWLECCQPNWDGYGASPVTWEAYKKAKTILASLKDIQPDSVGAEPDGCVVLEWCRGPDKVLSVSVKPDGCVAYAHKCELGDCWASIAHLGHLIEFMKQT